MKIYLIEKKFANKLINLGGKIDLTSLNKELNLGNTIILRNVEGEIQTDFRIRKVPEVRKRDRGYKTIKAFYVINLEIGKKGFENFSPKEVINEQNLRFRSLDRLIIMLEAKQKLNKADWLIDRTKKSQDSLRI